MPRENHKVNNAILPDRMRGRDLHDVLPITAVPRQAETSYAGATLFQALFWTPGEVGARPCFSI